MSDIKNVVVCMPNTNFMLAKEQNDMAFWELLNQKQVRAIEWDLNKGDEQCKMEDIEFAVVRDPPRDFLTKFPNLKAIQSIGAGVDHLANVELPQNVPVLRIIDPLMCERMATFVTWAVLDIQRKNDVFYISQQETFWNKLAVNDIKDNNQFNVGIMGLGAIGGACAQILLGMGYRVCAWRRSLKNGVSEGLKCFHGDDQLSEFLKECDVVVCLLPLTDLTRNILNKKTLYQLPKGSSVISLARGEHVVEEDLLDALNDGQINRAILDVFRKEPLLATSSLWQHPKVRVFPHISALTPLDGGLQQIVDNYQCVVNGQEFNQQLVVDMSRGY